MLNGISKQKAIEHMAKGKEVLVCDRNLNTGNVIALVTLDKYLEGLDFLVDVPAVENPDFKQAVADMIEKDEEKQAPPRSAGRCSSSGEDKADVQEKV